MAEVFRAAGVGEVALVVTYLSGRLPQRWVGVGWGVLKDAAGPAEAASLEVGEVDAALEELAGVSGKGARAERKRLVDALLGAATEEERAFLVPLIRGEVRQGALDAVAVEALAQAYGAPVEGVRQALMLGGSLGEVARVLAGGGELSEFRLEVGRPVLPMLAQSAKTLAEAVQRVGAGGCAVEEKLDGVRIQVHRSGGGEVRVFSRTLVEMTERVPEVVEVVRALPGGDLVLDGELLAVGEDGRPRPFQETSGRVGSGVGADGVPVGVPLTPVFFDVLYEEGRDLLATPDAERRAVLERVVGDAELRVRRIGPVEDLGAAEEFQREVLARGHEGVVVKGLDAGYRAGRRGASWVKVKPVHTLDLVVLGAEWGSGRRTGWLSNLHLGARGEDGSYVMLGKTFKGLTDEVLAWQTARLKELAVSEEPWGVRVRPELVVEIAFDGVQRSTRYPAGVTLRFARVVRYREDKGVGDVEGVGVVRGLLVG
ncbi:putative DNA ligase [Streptomyces spiroverticillatus]|uniref:DNA ligase n=1 Tax=Streptomyces finlayi TaxID=67296 RepID=A0A919C824_9ACTN|nr:putative DNA ligase [Streptomyces spiroverticillatus]GHC82998.1 putative DNA ligase [Streptomyces finlayi]